METRVKYARKAKKTKKQNGKSADICGVALKKMQTEEIIFFLSGDVFKVSELLLKALVNSDSRILLLFSIQQNSSEEKSPRCLNCHLISHKRPDVMNPY